MKKKRIKKFLGWLLCLCLLAAAVCNGYVAGQKATNVLSPARSPNRVIVIDAGHGGEDGGAISHSGAIESGINLSIALKLDQLMALFGFHTVLLRDQDISLHDSDAQTLREKKVSDLQNRVKIIQGVEQPVLISIHQNKFTRRAQNGSQVFYRPDDESIGLAQLTQEVLRTTLNQSNKRQAAPIPDSIYLMQHIECPAILVECGFLSNPTEDLLLQDNAYQLKVAAALLISCCYYYA